MEVNVAPNLSVSPKNEIVEEKTVCENCTCKADPIHVLVEIDTRLMTKDQKDTLFEVEKGLLSLGIVFDTGFGSGHRHWEWDWSLKGPIKIIPKKLKQEIEQ
jgi:hypothetical protein